MKRTMLSMEKPKKEKPSKTIVAHAKSLDVSGVINGILYCQDQAKFLLTHLKEHLMHEQAKKCGSAPIVSAIEEFIPHLANARTVADCMSRSTKPTELF